MTRVLASLPAVCAVCRNDREVLVVRSGANLLGHARRCPHCSPRSGEPIPIYVYPTRTDLPRGAA